MGSPPCDLGSIKECLVLSLAQVDQEQPEERTAEIFIPESARFFMPEWGFIRESV